MSETSMPPVQEPIDLSAVSAFSASKTMLQSKYSDAGSWAVWAANLLSQKIADIKTLLDTDIGETDVATLATTIADIATAIDAITQYTPPVDGFTYVSPSAPVMEAVPSFTSPILGTFETFLDIPAYTAPTVPTIATIPSITEVIDPAIPSVDLNFTNAEFTDASLETIRRKIFQDLSVSSTGLGDAERGMFESAIARENSMLADTYAAQTTQFGNRGFPQPPGALTAAITEATREKSIRLTDINTQILAESARLAVTRNNAVLAAAIQFLDIVARVFDSKIMRDFESAKTTVIMAIEGFKQEVALILAKVDINKTAIEATVAANAGAIQVYMGEITGQVEPIKAIAGVNQSVSAVNQATVQKYLGEIEGQVAPMKAVAGINQALASIYSAEVSAATGDLQAQLMPEELKIKGIGVNAQLMGTKAELVAKEVTVAIDAAIRKLAMSVSTVQGLAQSAAQMIASSLNSVNVSSSLGFNANVTQSSSEIVSTQTNISK